MKDPCYQCIVKASCSAPAFCDDHREYHRNRKRRDRQYEQIAVWAIIVFWIGFVSLMVFYKSVVPWL